MKQITLVSSILIAALSWTGAAHANGRFPRALHLVEDPCDADHLVLTATYGMVSTFDRGRRWFHTCERGFSLRDEYAGDPQVALLRDGKMLVDVQSAIHGLAGGGCGFRQSLALAGEQIADFTVATKGGELVVALATAVVDGGVVHRLHESRDGGSSWQVVGSPLPASTIITIDVAPSDPDRIYATGLADDVGVFLRSSDHGSTWTVSPIPNTDYDAQPYIAAVHPADANTVFVRTDAWTNRALIDTAADALLYTKDGGRTWTRAIEPRQAKLLGFALSPDGKTVLAGYGDTSDPAVDIDDAVTGLFSAPLETMSFTQVRDGSVTCLTWSAAGVFICTPEADTGFQLGLARAPESELTPLLRLADLQGPLPGCQGVCDWSTTCVPFAACGVKPDRDAGILAARSCAAAPVTDAGARAEGGGGDGAGGGNSSEPSSGCSCRTAQRGSDGSPAPTATWLGLAVAGLCLRRSRRMATVSR
jgi:hypothetical protein